MKFLTSTIVVTSCLISLPVLAQVSPDGTTSTTVTPTPTGLEINNGDVAGENLFHSFEGFSVPTGSEAFFNNADNISNIFSRVTGGNISNIDGILRANGTANLYLINPAGIVFGEGASLQLGGSFYGSTADSILFPDGEFSATNLDNPPLITINAPIGLNFRDEPQPIVNSSQFNTVEETLVTAEDIVDENGEPFTFTGITSIAGLEVNPGQDIYLIGGDVVLDRGGITASEGRVELGGLAESGTVEINPDGTLAFPTDLELADVSVTNDAMVNVTGGGGGFITVNARNLTVNERSQLLAGIAEGAGSEDAVAGDIVINATDSVNVTGNDDINFRFRVGTVISNLVGLPSLRRENPEEDSTAIGNSGSININTNLLATQVQGGAAILGFGTGDLGDVNVVAETVSLNGSALISQVIDGSVGNSGNINVDTGSFEATNFFLGTDNASLRAEDRGGDINIQARDFINLDGGTTLTVVRNNFSGDSGDINLKADNITINNNSFLGTDYRGQGEGNGGDINIEAQNLLDVSGIVFLLTTAANTTGNSGNLSFKANNIRLDENSELGTRTQILASTTGAGDAGTVSLNATENLTIDNESLVLSQVRSGATGNGGDIKINAGSLSLSNFALISANTQQDSFGSAGNIEITTNSIQVTDGALIDTLTQNASDAGNILIETENLEVIRGGKISSNTNDVGNAGDITINAAKVKFDGANPPLENPFDEVLFQDLVDATGIFVNASDIATGNAGNITVNTSESLNLSNEGQINLDNQGLGNGGNLIVTGDTLNLDRGIISAITSSGEQGNIDLNITETIRLESNSSISAEALNQANGGNITIDTNFVIATPNQNSDIVASAEEGNGGNIEIIAESLFGIEERNLNPTTNDINASSQFGLDGSISIETPEVNSLRETPELSNNVVAREIVSAANSCTASSAEEASGLVVRGKGGVPPEPTEPFQGQEIITEDDLTTTEDLVGTFHGTSLPKNTNNFDSNYIPPSIKPVMHDENGEPVYIARGLIVKPDGGIILTAYPTANIQSRQAEAPINCDT